MRSRTRNLRQAATRLAVLGGAGLLALAAAGCEDTLYRPRCERPNPPVEVYSITGDEEIYLFWSPADDVSEEFVVYRSDRAYGTYVELGHTRGTDWVDRSVRNGRTYYYAVSALGPCDRESDLSREIVHDTPRPEGYDARLYDADGNDWVRSGWDFSAYRALPWDHVDADVYYIVSDGVPYLVATDLDTDIQDAGYAGFDDVSWAPEGGWSPSGAVEVIPGHVYVIWTRNNHFAKLRAVALGGGRLTFDWAYQVDAGNPELAPRPPRDLPPLSVRPPVRPS